MPSLNELLHDLKRIEAHREKLTDKKIEKIYKQLLKDLNSNLADVYAKYSDPDGKLYKHYLNDKRRYARFLEEIVKSVDKMTPDLKKQIMQAVEDCYTEVFKGTVKAVKTSNNMSELYGLVDLNRPEILKRSVENNVSKLTLPYMLEKHRAEIIYDIQQVLTLGLMNGDRYDQMAKKIADRCNVSEGKAMNITRTEFHRNIEAGQHDVAMEIVDGLEGSDLVYIQIYRTMKDQKVRPNRGIKGKPNTKRNAANHVKMEGQVRKVGEPFRFPDGTKTLIIGSSGKAKHDCNCRCFAEYDLITVAEYEAIMKKGGYLT